MNRIDEEVSSEDCDLGSKKSSGLHTDESMLSCSSESGSEKSK